MNNQESSEKEKNIDNLPEQASFFKNKRNFLGIIFLAVILLAIIFLVIFKTYKAAPTSILEEAGSMKKSTSQDWWLNSGGIMNFTQEGFSTVIGNLDKNNYWRKLYAKNNPGDTDDGYHPQNIFRLVIRGQWQNLSQQVYFNIAKINLSDSKNRNESNGVLLFNRYQDGDNLYYAGVRVDGNAVIKKKIEGKYYTMIEKPVWTNNKKYDTKDNPNQIPNSQWLGIKTELENTGKTVAIKLYIDKEGKGDWQLVLETEDKGDKYGKSPFLDEGYAGIRTDFMDVYFKSYSISELK